MVNRKRGEIPGPDGKPGQGMTNNPGRVRGREMLEYSLEASSGNQFRQQELSSRQVGKAAGFRVIQDFMLKKQLINPMSI